MPRGAQRQRLCLQVPRLAESCSGHGIEGQEEQARHASDQWNGRAVQQKLAGRVGPRDALWHIGRQKRPVTGLPADR